MSAWFWYAVGAAVLYGAHQIFTKLAADRISDGLGGFVVEGSAALTILPSSRSWLKHEIITSPSSTATPLNAMKPTAAEMLNGIPKIHSAKMPPAAASGTPV